MCTVLRKKRCVLVYCKAFPLRIIWNLLNKLPEKMQRIVTPCTQFELVRPLLYWISAFTVNVFKYLQKQQLLRNIQFKHWKYSWKQTFGSINGADFCFSWNHSAISRWSTVSMNHFIAAVTCRRWSWVLQKKVFILKYLSTLCNCHHRLSKVVIDLIGNNEPQKKTCPRHNTHKTEDFCRSLLMGRSFRAFPFVL